MKSQFSFGCGRRLDQASLRQLFTAHNDAVSQQAVAAVELGLADDPGDRIALDHLETTLAELLGEFIPPPPAPTARFCSDDQIVRFRDHDYRIVTGLGSGTSAQRSMLVSRGNQRAFCGRIDSNS